jgi:hypothetical protein
MINATRLQLLQSKNHKKILVSQNRLKPANSNADSRPEQRDCPGCSGTLLLRRVRCRLQNYPFCCYWHCCCLFADQKRWSVGRFTRIRKIICFWEVRSNRRFYPRSKNVSASFFTSIFASCNGEGWELKSTTSRHVCCRCIKFWDTWRFEISICMASWLCGVGYLCRLCLFQFPQWYPVNVAVIVASADCELWNTSLQFLIP